MGGTAGPWGVSKAGCLAHPYAGAIMYESSEEVQALEVIHVWNRTIWSIDIFPQGEVWVGENPRSHYQVPLDQLPLAQPAGMFPLVRKAGGKHHFCFTMAMEGYVLWGRQVTSFARLVQLGRASPDSLWPGTYRALLEPGSRICIHMGEMTFLLGLARVPRELKTPLLDRVDRPSQPFTVLSVLLHLLALVILFVIPTSPLLLSQQGPDPSNPFLYLLLTPSAQAEEEWPSWVREILSPEEGEAYGAEAWEEQPFLQGWWRDPSRDPRMGGKVKLLDGERLNLDETYPLAGGAARALWSWPGHWGAPPYEGKRRTGWIPRPLGSIGGLGNLSRLPRLELTFSPFGLEGD